MPEGESGSTAVKDSVEIDKLVQQITGQLSSISDSALLDAQVLLAHIIGKDRTWIVSHPGYQLDIDQMNSLRTAVQRLIQGQPLPYVLGSWEFFGIPFYVTPHVLIPRPETELLVEYALSWCCRSLDNCSYPLRIADIGTGTGCIAVSLLLNLPPDTPKPKLTACDISIKALHIAKINAERHQVMDNITFLQADLLSPFQPSSLDLVCANLPYIPSPVLDKLSVAQHEPRLALDGGPTGIYLLQQLMVQAANCLRPGGLLLAEIEATLGQQVMEAARTIFPFASLKLVQDYAGHDRLLCVQDQPNSPQSDL